MYLPLSWLKDYVDIDITPKELEKVLFDCGFEVEEIIEHGTKISKIVVCQIKEIAQHPSAERLRITQVDAGAYGILQIITNATNVKIGDYVPVAVDGALLFDGSKISNGKLRGEPSYGMFCGGEEIGINDDIYPGASGDSVLILNEAHELGMEINEALGLKDYVFDVSVLANRPDCQSILGLAREIACATKKQVREPDLSYEVSTDKQSNIQIEVKNTDLCPRYIGHYCSDVKIEDSPQWLKKRLSLCGIKSINSIVDITNYVLLELGQPMHAFNYDTISGEKITVRLASEGEKMTTLDEKEVTLNKDALVICDAEKPVALAGIMGGINSQIDNQTTHVLFECAKFARDNVRKTARVLGKSTDSSSRYAKGVDEYTTERAIDRALNLFQSLNVGKISAIRVDCKIQKQEQVKPLNTTFAKINGVLGIEVPTSEIIDILTRLNFDVKVNGDNLTVTPPPYREDVEGYADLSEEVIRMYGYHHIKPTLLKFASVTAGGLSEEQKLKVKVQNHIAKLGFNEVINFSFYSKKMLESLNFASQDKESKFITLQNPISENYEIMRTSLIPSLLNIISKNLKKFNMQGDIFELANIYYPKELPMNDFPIENQTLSLASFGDNANFFKMKGVLENIADLLDFSFDMSERSECPYLHPGISAKIMLNGKHIGDFGQVKYETLGCFDIEKKVIVATLNYEELVSAYKNNFTYKPLSKFADVKRDLALVADESITSKQIEDVIRSSAKKNITDVTLFDVYRSAQIGENKKSMAYSITFASNEKELSTADVDAFIKKILGGLKHRLQVEIR